MLEGFVYVIESPGAADLLSDQVEGRALCSALHLARIPHVYSLASNCDTLRTALGARLVQTLQQPLMQGRRPILHLSMHGNDGGVGLTSGEFLSWDDLESELRPLMNFMRGGLLITMSSCFGLAGCRMAMNASNNQPFWALVGHSGSVDWSDAAVAYITFYHQFFKETPLPQCVALMRASSGDNAFLFLEGQALKTSWIQSVANVPSGTGLLSLLGGASAA